MTSINPTTYIEPGFELTLHARFDGEPYGQRVDVMIETPGYSPSMLTFDSYKQLARFGRALEALAEARPAVRIHERKVRSLSPGATVKCDEVPGLNGSFDLPLIITRLDGSRYRTTVGMASGLIVDKGSIDGIELCSQPVDDDPASNPVKTHK